jgi:iron complex outermembrane receptor protein
MHDSRLRSAVRTVLAGTMLAGSALAATSVAAAPGPAAASAGPSDALEEIIVTGTRREERLVDVPVTVQVFTEETIRQAGITRPQDFLNLTPNVTFIQSNHAGEAFVNIRGQTSVRQSESAVAVVIDGVQLATQNEFNGELFDIQQIEILKGPQGALYGRNASAGAIIVTTKAPTNELSGSALMSYGNWNSSRANLSVSGPVVEDRLTVRGAFAYTNSDGPFENIVTGENSYRSDEKTGRVRFDWRLTDAITADLRIGGSTLRGGAIAANAQGPGIRLGGVPSPVDGNATDVPFVTDVPGLNRQLKRNASLKVDFDLGIGTLTSVTAYNNIVDNYQAKLFPYQAPFFEGNDAGNAILFGDQTQKYRIENSAFSQEIRITSKGDGPIRWQGGIYFLDSEREFITEQGYNGRVPLNPNGTPNVGVGGYLPNPTGPIFASLNPAIGQFLFGPTFNGRFSRLLQGGGALLPTIGIDGLNTVNPTNSYDVTKFDARNYAPFGNVQWSITDAVELGVAARYDVEKREVETRTPNVQNPFGGGSFNRCLALFGNNPSACKKDEEFKQLQPKVNLNWRLREYASVYASWGRSFKSGGFNQIGSRETVIQALIAAGSTRQQAEALTFLQDTYEKEVADAYEIGFKSEWLDRRLSVNGAIFKTDVENAQQFSFFPVGSIQAVSSIDEVGITGGEIEFTVRATDWLTLFGGYGKVDAEIEEYAAQPSSVGNTTPYVADYNWTLGFQGDRPIRGELRLVARAEYNRSGPVWFDSANTPDTQRDAVGLLNARLGIAGDRWEVSAWARNLTDEEYRVESVVLPTGIGVFNPGFIAFPRSAGVEARFTF